VDQELARFLPSQPSSGRWSGRTQKKFLTPNLSRSASGAGSPADPWFSFAPNKKLHQSSFDELFHAVASWMSQNFRLAAVPRQVIERGKTGWLPWATVFSEMVIGVQLARQGPQVVASEWATADSASCGPWTWRPRRAYKFAESYACRVEQQLVGTGLSVDAAS